MRFQPARIFAILLGLTSLNGCGPSDDAPSIPVPQDQSYEGEQNSGDSVVAEPGEIEDPATIDAESATRLATLPAELSSQIEACEREGRFFHLAKAICTDKAIVSYPCRLDETFLNRLDESTLAPLAEYLSRKGKKLQLYACTEDSDTIHLYFFHYQNRRLNHKALNVAKAPAS